MSPTNKSYIALFTENAHGGQSAATTDLLLIFAQRDDQTKADVASTRQALEADGYGVHIQEFSRLADVPDIWCLPKTPEAAPAVTAQFSQSQLSAIHEALKLLAGRCDGAHQLDGMGFNKLDADFGRSLAQSPRLSQKQAEHGLKLIKKYHRQIPSQLFNAAGATLTSDDLGTSADNPSHEPRTPAELVNRKYTKQDHRGCRVPCSGDEVAHNGCEEPYGDTYQVGVEPGSKKLAQFQEIFELTGTPALYSQEDKGRDAMVYVKLFDPCGSWTWYLTEFSKTAPDGTQNLAFGLVCGLENEIGYIDIAELSAVQGGHGIGIEIDMHFTPQSLKEVRAALQAGAN